MSGPLNVIFAIFILSSKVLFLPHILKNKLTLFGTCDEITMKVLLYLKSEHDIPYISSPKIIFAWPWATCNLTKVPTKSPLLRLVELRLLLTSSSHTSSSNL